MGGEERGRGGGGEVVSVSGSIRAQCEWVITPHSLYTLSLFFTHSHTHTVVANRQITVNKIVKD